MSPRRKRSAIRSHLWVISEDHWVQLIQEGYENIILQLSPEERLAKPLRVPCELLEGQVLVDCRPVCPTCTSSQLEPTQPPIRKNARRGKQRWKCSRSHWCQTAPIKSFFGIKIQEQLLFENGSSTKAPSSSNGSSKKRKPTDLELAKKRSLEDLAASTYGSKHSDITSPMELFGLAASEPVMSTRKKRKLNDSSTATATFPDAQSSTQTAFPFSQSSFSSDLQYMMGAEASDAQAHTGSPLSGSMISQMTQQQQLFQHAMLQKQRMGMINPLAQLQMLQQQQVAQQQLLMQMMGSPSGAGMMSSPFYPMVNTQSMASMMNILSQLTKEIPKYGNTTGINGLNNFNTNSQKPFSSGSIPSPMQNTTFVNPSTVGNIQSTPLQQLQGQFLHTSPLAQTQQTTSTTQQQLQQQQQQQQTQGDQSMELEVTGSSSPSSSPLASNPSADSNQKSLSPTRELKSDELDNAHLLLHSFATVAKSERSTSQDAC